MITLRTMRIARRSRARARRRASANTLGTGLNVSDYTYENLRRRIASGEFPPGFVLRADRLAATLQVSRTPVHEALVRISGEGLVNIEPRHGATIISVTREKQRDICDLLQFLEGYAASLAATEVNPANRDSIQSAHCDMERAVEDFAATAPDESKAAAIARADARFHLAVINAARNDFLRREILRIHLIHRVGGGGLLGHQRTVVGGRLDRYLRALNDHAEVQRAIVGQDPTRAAEAMRRHIPSHF